MYCITIGGPPLGELNLQPQISWKQSRILLSHSDKSLDLVMRSENFSFEITFVSFLPVVFLRYMTSSAAIVLPCSAFSSTTTSTSSRMCCRLRTCSAEPRFCGSLAALPHRQAQQAATLGPSRAWASCRGHFRRGLGKKKRDPAVAFDDSQRLKLLAEWHRRVSDWAWILGHLERGV